MLHFCSQPAIDNDPSLWKSYHEAPGDSKQQGPSSNSQHSADQAGEHCKALSLLAAENLTSALSPWLNGLNVLAVTT